MGIARRFVWVLIFLPLVAMWCVEMTGRWILTGERSPHIAFDPWMDRLYQSVVGKEEVGDE